MGEIFVSKLAEVRKIKGLTQRQLADIVGVDPSTIRNWERDRGGVDAFVKVAKICSALECSPDDLYESEDLATEAIANDQ